MQISDHERRAVERRIDSLKSDLYALCDCEQACHDERLRSILREISNLRSRLVPLTEKERLMAPSIYPALRPMPRQSA
jgi:hypothetical protein